MPKIEPIRTCVVCRSKGTKENFFKIVKNKSGEVFVETNKKLDGRGAYVCKKQECVSLCKKKRTLNKVFKTEVPESVYGELENGLGSNK